MGMSLSMPLRQPQNPNQHPGPADEDDYPGDLTASEAVKAVTQLLEASSRKLQKVTEEQQGGGSRGKERADEAPALMNVRLDKSGSQEARAAGNPAPPQVAPQPRGNPAEVDQDDSDIDAISVDGDVDAFDEDEDEEYYSDDEYDEDEDYDDEDGVLYLSDDEGESDYSENGDSNARSSCYDSEEERDEQYPVAEVMPFHAPIRRKRNSHSAEQAAAHSAGGPSTPPRPHYSTIPYLPGSRRNPVTGKQMREILDRLSPAARHNYQQALIREHQLEMEMEKHGEEHHGQLAPSQPPMQQSTQHSIPPPQAQQPRQPSVLDDPAVMASPPDSFS
jgi:hypothetical protein